MSRTERKLARVQISMLHRAANQHEDRQTDEGRIQAFNLRRQANQLIEILRMKG